jgi:glycosyltransferase involved in cell wall biosynthesis
MGISVVIPTFNSSRTIRRCVTSVKGQTKSGDSILVIDRFSRDRTQDIARAAGAKVIQTEANRSSARNFGANYSNSHGILFLDSDMMAPPQLLEECEAKIADFEALVIPEVSVGEGFWAKCKSMERQSNVGNALLEAPRCFQRDAFFLLGGYNPRIEAGEDWDLCNRAKQFGLTMGRVNSTILHDEGSASLPELLRKKYVYGRNIGSYLVANPRAGLKQINPITRTILPGLRTLPKDPAHGIGVVILKAFEFGAAAVGRLIGPTGVESAGESGPRERDQKGLSLRELQ